jgi:DedD protein
MIKRLIGLMDRRVKERLVGATILVVLLVLIVPELLSGPKSPAPAKVPALPATETTEPMRNVTVDLATRKATAADLDAASATGSAAGPDSDAASSAASNATSTPPAEAPSAAAPTISTLRAQQPSDAPPVENGVPPPRSSLTAKTAASHDAAHAGWAVQLGSFASRVNADTLVRQLKGHEAPAYVLSSGRGTELRYKVRIGPLADRAAAERMRLKLAKDGRAGSLVAPDGGR